MRFASRLNRVSTLPSSRETAYEYDHLDRRIKVILPDPDGVGGEEPPEYLYSFDIAGRLIQETDPLGNETDYEYDNLNRLVRVALPDPDGVGDLERPETLYTYDFVGNLLSLTDPVGNITVWTYDKLDRVTKERNALNKDRLWNETKNVILVSAQSATSDVDPQPEPPACFLNQEHVAKLTETATTKEKAAKSDDLPPPKKKKKKSRRKSKQKRPPHQPKRVVRTVLSSMESSREFGVQMEREARRRRFFEAERKAFVGDGLPCNWAIHEARFRDFTPILDFTHAVSYLFRAARLCAGSPDEVWAMYTHWMIDVWRGLVGGVIGELRGHQERLGLPSEGVADDDPREQLRLILGYLENNRERMRYDEYRRQGLPTTSAWMESAVKEMNYRVKGTEMFWNNPAGAEAILRIRAAALSDDGRLARFLTRRPGRETVRRPRHPHGQAA